MVDKKGPSEGLKTFGKGLKYIRPSTVCISAVWDFNCFYLEIAAFCISVFICWKWITPFKYYICMYITLWKRGRKMALVSAHYNFLVLFGNKFL